MKIPDSADGGKPKPVQQATNGSSEGMGREGGEVGPEPETNTEGDYVKLFLDENMVET